MKAEGMSMPKDLVSAYIFLFMAKKHGNPKAEAVLVGVRAAMSADEIAEEERAMAEYAPSRLR